MNLAFPLDFDAQSTLLVCGGLVLGYVSSLLLSTRRLRHVEVEHRESVVRATSLQEQRDAMQQQLEEKQRLATTLEGELETLRKEITAYAHTNGQLEVRAQDLETQLAEKTGLWEKAQLDIEELRKAQGELALENRTLLTSIEKNKERHAEQLQLLQENKEQLKQEFSLLANQIFEQKGKDLREKNSETLHGVLNPFKEEIVAFKKRVEDIHHKETTASAALRSELGNLKELNQKITKEAHDLATALRGQKKMQGNWGEMILENILDRSGLVRDKDYRREVASTNKDAARQRPDAVVYLPGDKQLIIDAKVSLNSYTDYINETDETQRPLHLKRHVNALHERLKELSAKDYADLSEFNSPDVVFMFVPIESAFVEALRADETLFQRALESNILIATPTTLLTSLNIVRQLWNFEKQNKHTKELSEKAGRVYDKLTTFVGSMEKLGRSLQSSRDVYEKAMNQFVSGKGNLIKQASEFKELGVRVKQELPAAILEKSSLELDFESDSSDQEVLTIAGTESNSSQSEDSAETLT